MPIRKLQLQPGVNLQRTPTLNTTQLSQSQLIRFYNGLPQKRGGWVRMVNTPLIGRCSGLHGWGDTTGVPYLAAGTEQRLSVLTNGVLSDITPLATTTNPAVQFSTTRGSSHVTITDPLYNPNAGDWINLTTQVPVGGVVLFGFLQVVSAPTSTTYIVTAPGLATSNVTNGGAVPSYTTANASPTVTVTLANHGYTTNQLFPALVPTTVAGVTVSGYYPVTVTGSSTFTITAYSLASGVATVSENGGNAQIQYLIPSGHSTTITSGSGFGMGIFGAGIFGNGQTGTIWVPQREWSLDNFGQDLIASPTNGGIYYWQPPAIAPATVMPQAPKYSTAVFVMSEAQIVVALGASVMGVQEPLLVRWCDAGDFTDWTATVTNQAGSYQIPQGSRLVGGLANGLGALLWTDVGLYQMTYQGLPFVFGFNPIAIGCGLIAKRAFAVVGSLVFWLSKLGFFMMRMGATAPTPIECPVWDLLADNWDLGQPGGFVMGANTLTNEFELFFPLATTSPLYVANTVEFGSVKFNYVEGAQNTGLAWDYSITPQLQRTAWQGQWTQTPGPIGNPVGADLAGLLQQHEIGYDADGSPMAWSWQTGDFDVTEGEDIPFVDWIIPDFVSGGTSYVISISVMLHDWPNEAYQTVGPFVVTPTTNFVPPFGARGRQMAIACSGSDAGSFNRLGALRFRAAADGRGV